MQVRGDSANTCLQPCLPVLTFQRSGLGLARAVPGPIQAQVCGETMPEGTADEGLACVTNIVHVWAQVMSSLSAHSAAGHWQLATNGLAGAQGTLDEA